MQEAAVPEIDLFSSGLSPPGIIKAPPPERETRRTRQSFFIRKIKGIPGLSRRKETACARTYFQA
jgi:hypothetical protein